MASKRIVVLEPVKRKPANFNCPFCGDSKVWKKGYVPHVGGEKRCRYVCWDCGRSFYEPEKKSRRRAKQP